jgi:flagellar hook assembly protein FlgD
VSLEVTIGDAVGRAIPGETITFTVSGSGSVDTSIQGNVTDNNGKVFARYVPGTVSGNVTVTASDLNVSPTLSRSVTIKVLAGLADTLTLSANPTSVTANGIDTSLVSAVLRDRFGNPVPNKDVVFDQLTGFGGLSVAFASTNESGAATTRYDAGITAGDALMRGTHFIDAFDKVADLVGITVRAGPPTSLDLSARFNRPAFGFDFWDLRAEVTDAVGNGVGGDPVSFSMESGPGSVTAIPVLTDASGVAVTSYFVGSAIVGSAVVRAIESLGLPTRFDTVTIALPADPETLIITSNRSVMGASPSNSAILTITVVDDQGRPVPGLTLDLSLKALGGTADSGMLGPVSDLRTGTYTVVYTAGSTADTIEIRAGIRTDSSVFDSVSIRLSSDTTPPPVPTGLTITAPQPDTVVLSWDTSPASDLLGFNVYRDNSSVPLNATPITATSYVIGLIASGEERLYRVTAVDQSYNESAKQAVGAKVVKASNGLVTLLVPPASNEPFSDFEIQSAGFLPDDIAEVSAALTGQGLKLIGAFYRLQPLSGDDLFDTVFPVESVFRYSDGDAAALIDEGAAALHQLNGGAWTRVTVTESSAALNFFRAKHTQFDGYYAILADAIAPRVRITSPTLNARVTTPLAIMGDATDSNLYEYRVEVAAGANPSLSAYSLIHAGSGSVVGETLAVWNIPGGTNETHTIRLSATDLAGNKASATVVVVVDGESPVARIDTPASGGVVRNDNVGIYGTASDSFLQEFRLSVRIETGAEAPVSISSVSVVNGLLGTVSTSGYDSALITATLFVLDQSGKTAEDSVMFRVDKIAPIIANATGDTLGTTGETVVITAVLTDNVGIESAVIIVTPPGGPSVENDFRTGSSAITLASNKVGAITYRIVVTDSAGNTAFATYTITVTDNDSPIADARPDGPISRRQGEVIAYDGSFSADNVGIVSMEWELGGGDTSTKVKPSKIYFTPGSFDIRLTVRDSAGLSDFDTEAVIVSNLAPIADAGEDRTILEDGLASFAGAMFDYDTPLSITWNFGDGGFAFGTLQPNHVYPDPGLYFVTLTVSDLFGGTGVDTVLVTVVNVNDPPAITSTPVVAGVEGVLYTYDVEASDPDVITSGDVLAFSLDAAPAGMSVNGATGVISWVPAYNQVLQVHDVEVRVTDLAGAFDTQAFTVTVSNVNDTPRITSAPETGAQEGVLYTYVVLATDTDLLAPGDSLTYQLDTAPFGMMIDSTSGVITWTPAFLTSGETEVQIRVRDLVGAFDTQKFRISVRPETFAPVITCSAVLPGRITPNGDTLSEFTTIQYTVSDTGTGNVLVRIRVLDVSGNVIRTIGDLMVRPQGLNASDTWDGRDDFGETAPDGEYRVELRATDINGNVSATDTRCTVVVDAVVFKIRNASASPAQINPGTGTGNDTTIISFELNKAASCTVTVVQSGALKATLMANQPCGRGLNVITYDASSSGLGNGTFSVIVQATTAYESDSKSFNAVVNQFLTINVDSVVDRPDPFSPQTGETSSIYFRLNALAPPKANVTIRFLNSQGVEVDLQEYSDLPAGSHIRVWDGLDGLGQSFSEGVYSYVIEADRGQRLANPIMGTIVIRNKGVFHETASSSDSVLSLTSTVTGITVTETPTPDRFSFQIVSESFGIAQSSFYVIEPSGTTFETPAIIAFRYSPELFGPKLRIVKIDPLTQQAVVIDSFVVNEKTHTIFAEISNLSLFVLVSADDFDRVPPFTRISVGDGPSFGEDPLVVSATTEMFLVVTDDYSLIDTTYLLINGETVGLSGEENRISLDGLTETQVLSYWSVDAKGNVEPVRTRTVFIDGGAPTFEMVTPQVISYRTPLAARLRISDIGSIDSTSVAISLDGLSRGFAVVSERPLEILVDTVDVFARPHNSQVTFHIRAADIMGNVGETTITVTVVDDVPPVTTLTIGSPRLDTVVGVGTPLVFTAVDQDGKSAIARTFAAVDSEAYSIVGAITLTGRGDGEHTITYYSEDVVGNAEVLQLRRLVLDAIPPAIAIAAPTETEYVGGESILIAFAITDSHDPSPVVNARLEGPGVVSVWNGQSLSALSIPAGSWRLVVDASDTFGNAVRAEGVSFSVIHDIRPPRTSIVVGAPFAVGGTDGGAPGETFVTSATVTRLSAVDDLLEVGDGIGLGVALTEFLIDDGGITDGDSFRLSGADGPKRIEYRSTDVLGNSEESRVALQRLDNTAPSLNAEINGPSYASGALNYITSASSVSLSASDGSGAGVARVEFDPGDGTGFREVAGELRFAEEGARTVVHRAADLLGNSSGEENLSLFVDNTAPLTTLHIGLPRYTDTDGTLYVTVSTPFALTAGDSPSGGAGIASTLHQIDGGVFDGSATFTITGSDGAHVVGYYSTDNLGNAEAEKTTTVVLDNAAPSVSVVIGNPKHTDGLGRVFVTSATPIALIAADSGSGLGSVTVSVDGGGAMPYVSGAPITLSSDGEHSISWSATDNLGQAVAGNVSVIVDNGVPTTLIAIDITDTRGRVIIPESLITLTAVDNGSIASGVSAIEYRIDTGVYVTYSGPFEIGSAVGQYGDTGPEFGAHLIAVRSTDRLGNVEAETTFAFTLSPALDISRRISYAPRTVMWWNDGSVPAAHRSRLEAALSRASLTFDTVIGRSQFVAALNSGAHNVFVILGDDEALEDEGARVLAERVNLGAGLLASVYSGVVGPMLAHDRSGGEISIARDNVLGIKAAGNVKDGLVEILSGVLRETGFVFGSIGNGRRIQESVGETVAVYAGVADEESGRGRGRGEEAFTDIAGVIREYGAGKAMYLAFDVASSADDIVGETVATVMVRALAAVSPETDVAVTDGLIAVEISVLSLVVPSDFHVAIDEIVPSELTVLATAPPATISGGALSWIVVLDAGESAGLAYTALLPAHSGPIATEADVTYLVRGSYRRFGRFGTTIVYRDAGTSLAAARNTIRTIITLVSRQGGELGRVEDALSRVEWLLANPPGTPEARKAAITSLLAAVENLTRIETAAAVSLADEARRALGEAITGYGAAGAR